jgi:hypothetical protein
MASEAIKNAFLNGLETIFKTMFTESVLFYQLDNDLTQVTSHREADKKYKTAIPLAAKVVLGVQQSEDQPEIFDRSLATISVPTKQLITHNIPRATQDDLDALKQAKFSYKGLEYEVTKVLPKTLVADEWHVYEFACISIYRSSLG